MSRILEDAGEIGCRHIYLDTLPFLQRTVYLYRKFGFYQIEKDNDSPIESAIYMRLDIYERYDRIIRYYFDCDDYDSKPDDRRFLREAKQYCDNKSYEFVWFYKNIEQLYIGK